MRAAEVTRPVETKTAASAAIGALITLIFGLASTYHWFNPPPPYLTALAITALTAVAGWLAPHTPRPQAEQPPLIVKTGTVQRTGSDLAARDGGERAASVRPG